MTRPSDAPPIWIEEQLGTGDGITSHFRKALNLRPIEPNTLKAYVVPDNTLDQLLSLEERRPLPAATVVVNELNADVQVSFVGSWMTATGGGISTNTPAIGHAIWVRYAWRPPRLERAKFSVKLDGKKQWIDLNELRDAIFRGRWEPDQTSYPRP